MDGSSNYQTYQARCVVAAIKKKSIMIKKFQQKMLQKSIMEDYNNAPPIVKQNVNVEDLINHFATDVYYKEFDHPAPDKITFPALHAIASFKKKLLLSKSVYMSRMRALITEEYQKDNVKHFISLQVLIKYTQDAQRMPEYAVEADEMSSSSGTSTDDEYSSDEDN